jgi:hypothetical protein
MRPVVIPAALSQASIRVLTPRRHGHGPYPVPLAGQVRQHPPSLALLEICDLDAEELRAAQAAAEEHGQDGPVALAGQGLRVRRIQQMVGLVLQQPVPYPGSLPLYSRNPFDRRRRRRVEHLVVGHLPGQLPDRRKPQVDGGRGETVRQERRPVLLLSRCT